MKALVKKKAQAGLWMENVAEPEVKKNDVLIKVSKTAICGTDIHIYNWDEWAAKTIPVPMVVGHEFAGVIEDFGENVKGFKRGDRVTAEGHITCGHCRSCRAGKRHLCGNTIGIGVNRPGAYAEYISVPQENVYNLPDMIDDDIAAILDPLGNASHTALSFDMVGEDVLITGAGPIGIMAAAIARHVGARHVVITDVNDYRLSLAKKVAGLLRTVNVLNESIADVMHELDMKEGFDVGLEMSGNPRAFNDMLKNMNCGGKIAILGLLPANTSIDWNQVIFKGLFLKGIYGREMFETWYKSISMLQGNLSIDPVITHRFSVDDFQQGFDVMRSGKSGKVILNWK
ncbi:MAG: L-threonine 3-dehydrogenase [Desulfobacteraceae bacterium]|nr:L-threonine 3-dehydrogenase [Desulfobacteraceae bacterium]